MLVLASPFLSPQNGVGYLNKNQNRHGSSSCIRQKRLDSFETRNKFQIARNSRKYHIPPWSQNLLLCPRTGATHLLLPCLHKKDSRGSFLTLSLCYPSSSPAECRNGQVHFTKKYLQGRSRKNQYVFKGLTGMSLCGRHTKSCHLSTSCMPWNKFTAGTGRARLLSLTAL